MVQTLSFEEIGDAKGSGPVKPRGASFAHFFTKTACPQPDIW
jgi:hypothetical protein